MSTKITIFDDNNIVTDDFQHYLVSFCKLTFLSNIQKDKLSNIEKFLLDFLGDKVPKVSGNLSFAESVLIQASNFFTIRRTVGKTYEIKLDENAKIFGTNIKLYSVCKMIDFGNFNCKPYPIFSDTLNWIKNNFQYIYKLYAGII